MMDLLTHWLVPLVQWLFVPLDAALGWLTHLGTLGALIAVGAATGLAVNLFQKYGSNQELLGRRRADLNRLKELQRNAKEAKDSEKAARLLTLASQISSRYALESLKPALYSIPPLCILAMWVGARLNHEPLRPGDTIQVIATFEDGASGFAHYIPNTGFTANGPVIAPIGLRAAPAAVPTSTEKVRANVAADLAAPSSALAAPAPVATSPQALWTIRLLTAGDFPLQIRHVEDRYTLMLPVRTSGGLPPEQAVVYRTESPTRDKLLSVELELRESVPSAWWNAWMQAMGVYFIAALASGLALRRILGIQ